MIFDTHILISQILYANLSNQMNFKLNRLAFAYGNVKPDFNNKDIKCSHTLSESLCTVNEYSKKLLNKNTTVKEFSVSLGVICHFASDYFCLYHREGNEKKGMAEHLIYEISVHLKLLTIILSGKLKLKNHKIFEDDVKTIVMELQNKYDSEKKCLGRDINYALSAASHISKLILSSSELYIKQKQADISKRYQFN
ncbi:MAG: zinc dependent phospholipase C family protein [Clostridiaceae bacterium]